MLHYSLSETVVAYCCLVFRSLGTVFGAGLTAVRHTGGIKCAADDVITGTRKVLDTAASDHDDAVLLKVVALTRDIACDFDPVAETDTGDLAESRVRLLGSRGLDSGAHASLLRAGRADGFLLQRVKGALKGRSLGFLDSGLSALLH